jgi:phosphate transport system substrate-binding protein
LRSKRSIWFPATLAATALLAAACSDDEATDAGGTETTAGDDTETTAAGEEPTEGEEPSGDISEVTGEIIVSGSSTVQPITQLVADEFTGAGAGVNITVDGPGTSDGFEAFCAGETDISDASRPISEDEVAACEEAGVEFIELYIADDGLSLLTNPSNESLTCVSKADAYALTGPESNGFTTWQDAVPLAEELGSDQVANYPEGELTVFGPGTESGTFGSYIEIGLEDIVEERVESGALPEEPDPAIRTDYQSSGDDNIIIDGIAGDPTSYGWVGFAFAQGAGDTVKILEVAEEAGGECVAPSPETVADGSYPFARPLFIYVSTTQLEENPAIEPFVTFYLEQMQAGLAEEAGYVNSSEERQTETQETFEAGTTGPLFTGE